MIYGASLILTLFSTFVLTYRLEAIGNSKQYTSAYRHSIHNQVLTQRQRPQSPSPSPSPSPCNPFSDPSCPACRPRTDPRCAPSPPPR